MRVQFLWLILIFLIEAFAEDFNVVNGKKYSCTGSLVVRNDQATCNGSPISPVAERPSLAPAQKSEKTEAATAPSDSLGKYKLCIDKGLSQMMDSFDCRSDAPRIAGIYFDVVQNCNLKLYDQIPIDQKLSVMERLSEMKGPSLASLNEKLTEKCPRQKMTVTEDEQGRISVQTTR